MDFKDALTGFVIVCGTVAFLVATVAIMAIMHGFVLSIMWGWFVASTLHVPPLTIVQAIGLSMVVGLFRRAPQREEKKDKKNAFLIWFFSPLIALALGWIVHTFFWV